MGTLSDMPPKTIRFPDDLAARIQAEAVRTYRSFSYVALRALEQKFPARASHPDPAAPTTMAEAAKRATLPPGVKTAREVLSDGVAAVDRAAAFRRASQRGKS